MSHYWLMNTFCVTVGAGLRRWPSAGVAVAVVRDSSPVQYFSGGVAEVASGRWISGGHLCSGGRVTGQTVPDLPQLAADLVRFLAALHRIDAPARSPEQPEPEPIPAAAGFASNRSPIRRGTDGLPCHLACRPGRRIPRDE